MHVSVLFFAMANVAFIHDTCIRLLWASVAKQSVKWSVKPTWTVTDALDTSSSPTPISFEAVRVGFISPTRRGKQQKRENYYEEWAD